MSSLRGVMVDAECPRCGQTSPPPESLLATCKRCGLVFPPHEVQHKLPTASDDVALELLPDPPRGVIARRVGPAIRIEWPVARYVALFYISAALLAAWFAASDLFATPFWIATAISVVLGVQQLIAKHVLVLDLHDAAVSHFVTLRLGLRRKHVALTSSVELRKDRFARYELGMLSGATIAKSADRAPLDYVAALISVLPKVE